MIRIGWISAWLTLQLALASAEPEGTDWLDTHGYTGCIQLSNEQCRVILEPGFGGRVLSYRLNDKEGLYIDPAQNGWVMKPNVRGPEPCAGRCDIGPENTLPSRDVLWRGRWTAEITGSRAARLTSQIDPVNQVQVVRVFVLAEDSSHLIFTQTVINVGDQEGRFCHWSRTFGKKDGICLVPLNPHSRYPEGYLTYGPGDVMEYKPSPDPNIRVRDGVLELLGAPVRSKFAIDASEGWMAYITRDDLLFLKTFAVYPDRVYGEMAGNTISIWYGKGICTELEPIGPLEIIQPGESFSYTEHWRLMDFTYPSDQKVDLSEIRKMVEQCSE